MKLRAVVAFQGLVVVHGVNSDAMVSSNVTVLPFFIKLHKVASSTVASLFNCVAVESGEDAYHGMLEHFKACNSRHSAWSHMNTNELERYGMAYFSYCGLGDVSQPVKIVTILRHPVDRFVSALRYFNQVRKRTDEVRKVMTAPEKVSIEEFQNLTVDIFSPDPRVHPEVRLHEYVDVFASLAPPWSDHKLPWPDSRHRNQHRQHQQQTTHRIRQHKRGHHHQQQHHQQQQQQDHRSLREEAAGSVSLVGLNEQDSEKTHLTSRWQLRETDPGVQAKDLRDSPRGARAQVTSVFATHRSLLSQPTGEKGTGHDEEKGEEEDMVNQARPRRYSPLDPSLPTVEMVEAAKNMLEKHFIVGLTENMAGFLALLSVELGWSPSQHLCLPYPCQLKHGNSAYNCSTAGQHMDDLTPAIRSEIDRLVAPDLKVYSHAQDLFTRQSAVHGGAYLERLAELESEEHSRHCDEKRASGLQSRCKSMRR